MVISSQQVAGFLTFLRRLAREAGGFDVRRDSIGLASVSKRPVSWQRRRFALHPVYMENLRVVSSETFERGPFRVPLRIERPGEWIVPASAFQSGPDFFQDNEDA